jgi:excisionase family DNA binding protein
VPAIASLDVPTSTAPQTWVADEVAAYLRINRRTVLKMVDRGEIPAVRLGKLYRFDPQKIIALFDGDASPDKG